MKTICCLLLLLLSGKVSGQVNVLQNPSFEASRRGAGITPKGWMNCGSADNTPPDTQPGSLQVDLPAADGHNYVSLVVRDDGSGESIGQKLMRSMKKDSVYVIRLDMARAPRMVSPVGPGKTNLDFGAPAALRVYGGNAPCDKKELLTESGAVDNTDWVESELVLKPKEHLDYIFLEAVHKSPDGLPYNGNLLIDHLIFTPKP